MDKITEFSSFETVDLLTDSTSSVVHMLVYDYELVYEHQDGSDHIGTVGGQEICRELNRT